MEIIDYARDYEAATKYFTELVSRLKPTDLDKSAPGEWTPRQVIHHLADSETQSYVRIRKLMAEPAGSTIQGWDEGMWAENAVLGYTTLPVENSIAVFKSVRAASLDILKRLSLEDLERSGVHTDKGNYTVAKWIKNHTNHPRSHVEQIEKAVAGA
ncbi:MAG: hypothetical protein F2734_02940 [Actinobacteria bacterium]|uniref:Unannotated protein n=1 Tax=freshwater metagenome TaxID=449393 RepID=A0A6J6FG48_9ZZZZ|nr:hypothetical protein [Actinomycetota bacterium]MTA23578.1 hypothetical protein [Actinomycetota bacterium]